MFLVEGAGGTGEQNKSECSLHHPFVKDGHQTGKDNASNLDQENQDGVIIAVLESGTLRWSSAGTEAGTAAGLLVWGRR